MSPALDRMTFDELSEIYRVEMNSTSLSDIRRDFFRASAVLLSSLRGEYEKQLAIDPDSVLCEGAEHRKKTAERLCKEVIRIRTKKISDAAILGALGSRNPSDELTDEEKKYYGEILAAAKNHLSELDRIRGKKITVATHLDEIPGFEEKPERKPEKPPEPPPRENPPEEFPEDDIPDPLDSPGMQDDFPPEPEEFPAESEELTAEPAELPPETEELPPEDTAPYDPMEPVPVVILEDLPEFAGPSRNYSLKKEDVVTIPRLMADALIESGKAVAVIITD